MLDASGDNNKVTYFDETANISINNHRGIPTQINKQSLIDNLPLFKENNNDSVHEMLEIKQGSALENLSDSVRELLASYLQDKNIEKPQQRYSPATQFKADIERLNNISASLLVQLQTNPAIEDLNKLIYTYREIADLKLGIIQFHNSGSLPVLGTNNMLPVTIRDARLQSCMDKDAVTQKPGDISEHWLEVMCNRARGATIFIEMHTNKHLVAIAKQNLMKIFASYNHKLLGNTESEFAHVVNQFNEDLFDLLIKYNHSNVTPLSKDDLKLVCDYSQLDEEHKHVITITSDVSNDQTPICPMIASLIPAAISNDIMEKEYEAINQFCKSPESNLLRERHFRTLSSDEENSLNQAMQQCPLWFRRLQQLEQELIMRFVTKISSNKKSIPAELRNVPCLRNTGVEITGTITNNKDLALNKPIITTCPLIPTGLKDHDEEKRIATANLSLLESWVEASKLQVHLLAPMRSWIPTEEDTENKKSKNFF